MAGDGNTPPKESTDAQDENATLLLHGQPQTGESLDGEPIFTNPGCFSTSLHITLNSKPNIRCLKNIVIHSISCFLVFTPFMAYQSMDSTLNARAGLGSLTFAVLYTGLILSCLLAPAVVRYAGCKETMMTSFIMQLIFSLTHMYSQFYTLLPSSLLVGLSLGPFWTAQGVYTTTIATQYSVITGLDYKKCLSRLYGIFNFFILSSQKFGNLIESVVLGRAIPNGTLETGPLDAHKIVTLAQYSNLTLCGAAFCSKTSSNVIPPTNMSNMYVLVGIFTAFCLLGIIFTAGFVDGLTKTMTVNPPDRETSKATTSDQSGSANNTPSNNFDVNMSDALTIHTKNGMYLIVPLLFYNGLQQGFVYGDYTEVNIINCYHEYYGNMYVRMKIVRFA